MNCRHFYGYKGASPGKADTGNRRVHARPSKPRIHATSARRWKPSHPCITCEHAVTHAPTLPRMLPCDGFLILPPNLSTSLRRCLATNAQCVLLRVTSPLPLLPTLHALPPSHPLFPLRSPSFFFLSRCPRMCLCSLFTCLLGAATFWFISTVPCVLQPERRCSRKPRCPWRPPSSTTHCRRGHLRADKIIPGKSLEFRSPTLHTTRSPGGAIILSSEP